MAGRLVVDRDAARSCFRAIFNEPIHIVGHDVHIYEPGEPIGPQAFQERSAKGKVWHERVIHDVEMDKVTSGFNCRVTFLRQSGEITGEYRGSDTGGHFHDVDPG
jgi:hypothetical protein